MTQPPVPVTNPTIQDGVTRWNLRCRSIGTGRTKYYENLINGRRLEHCSMFFGQVGTSMKAAERLQGVDFCLSLVEPPPTSEFQANVWFIVKVRGRNVTAIQLRRISTGVGFTIKQKDTYRLYPQTTRLPGHNFKTGDVVYQWCEE